MSRALALALLLAGCGGDEDAARPGSVAVPGHAGAFKSEASVRALRRAYDGAPPVIPHGTFSGECTSCHDERGIEVAGVGFAPPSPHGTPDGPSALARCTQCHVPQHTDELFVASAFVGLLQDLRHGTRAHEGAPPVIPHDTFLRGNCLACHSGPAAREEIRTSHPERAHCRQCHVERTADGVFAR